MSANAIWYNNDGIFCLDTGDFSAAELGTDIVTSLIAGRASLAAGLTVSYAVEMLRITGRTGQFHDSLANTPDHDFDPDRPTVGIFSGEAQHLRAEARVAEDIVAEACLNTLKSLVSTGFAAQSLKGAAKVLEAQARELRDSDAANEAVEHLLASAKQLRRQAREIKRASKASQKKVAACMQFGSQHKAAEVLRAGARKHEETRPGCGAPLAKAYALPTVKCADRRYGADAIWWNAKANCFQFGGCQVGTRLLGRLLAHALMRNEEHLSVGFIDVTVNGLVEMAREVGIKGEFGIIVE